MCPVGINMVCQLRKPSVVIHGCLLASVAVVTHIVTRAAQRYHPLAGEAAAACTHR